MKRNNVVGILGFIAGTFLGLICGCLVTWYPVRLLFCAYYNAPDCEEIVLITWPFYCIIAPLIGGVIAVFLYRSRSRQETGDIGGEDKAAGQNEDGKQLSADVVEEKRQHAAAEEIDDDQAGDDIGEKAANHSEARGKGAQTVEHDPQAAEDGGDEEHL